MYFPFITTRSDTYDQRLYRRKGGGGRGGGGKSGGSSSGSSSGSSGKSGGSSGGSPGKSSSPISTGGTSRGATAFGAGGGQALAIPSGQLFAGRLVGGGTRNQVYGDRAYGSGYPGIAGRGTAGRGFPFVFWPLAWGGGGLIASGAYLHTTEYGRYDNTSRPGGIMLTAAFPSSSFQNTTFRIVADNTTVSSLVVNIVASCSAYVAAASTITSSTFNDSLVSPKPEQTVQYYRASSVALTLDGYNNTGALEAEGTPDTPLPTNIDSGLLNCLNGTIGKAVPLVDSASLRMMTPSVGLVSFIWVLWCLSSMF